MRLLPAALLALVVLVSGCSSDEGGGADATDGGSEAQRVGIAGITFDLPEDWTALDSEEMTDDVADGEVLQEFKDDMGLTDEQLQQTLDSVDLYLVTGEGAKDGFLDNIVGTEVPGSMPNDSQLEAEVLSLGADVVSLDHVDTDAGEAVRVVYELPAGSSLVRGQALSIPTDDSVVTFTVSAGASETSAELMDGLVGSVSTD